MGLRFEFLGRDGSRIQRFLNNYEMYLIDVGIKPGQVMHIAKATSASHPPLRWHVFYKSDTKYPLSTRADFPLRSGIGQCVLVIVPQEMPPCSFRETCTAVYYFSCSGHLFDWNFLCVSELFIWSSLKAIRLKAQSKTNAFFRLFIQLNVLYVVALKVIF